MNRYQALIEKVFFDHFTEGTTEFEFHREELENAVTALGVARVKNLGDVTYSFRHRQPLPNSILKTQPEGHEWIIEGAGKAGISSNWQRRLAGSCRGKIWSSSTYRMQPQR